MQKRSFGITTLAFGSVMIALYSQFAAVSLILTGSVWSSSGSIYATASFVLGALFFGITFASYFLAYGFWTRKSWAFAGSVTLFVTLVVASVALSVVSTNFTSTVLPLAAAIAGIWYANRPAVKAELVVEEAPAAGQVNAGMNVAEPAH